MRARIVSADARYPPCRCRNRIVDRPSGRGDIAAREGDRAMYALFIGASPVIGAEVGPGRGLGRVRRQCNVAGGQVRDASTRCNYCRCRHRRGRRTARWRPRRLPAPRPASPWIGERVRQHEERSDPRHQVVIGLGFGNQLARSRRSRRLRSPRIGMAPASRHRHCRDPKRSPMASARSRPSSAAARTPMGSPATKAACACWPRIWINLHWSPSSRARPLASAK